MVLPRVTQRGKSGRGHSLIFVSMALRVLEIFRKATSCADRETAPDRRECPDSIAFPRHGDSGWFIENVIHNGEHPLGRGVFIDVKLQSGSSRPWQCFRLLGQSRMPVIRSDPSDGRAVSHRSIHSPTSPQARGLLTVPRSTRSWTRV